MRRKKYLTSKELENEIQASWAREDLEWERECLKRKLVHRENRCRLVFEKIFKGEFKRVRPRWLCNAIGHRLELDGFNEELKLAFEYQGEYHYRPIKWFNKSRSLEEIRKLDDLKKEICILKGVNLIEIPYWIKDKELREHILKTRHEVVVENVCQNVH